jgi:hypothetical protein
MSLAEMPEPAVAHAPAPQPIPAHEQIAEFHKPEPPTPVAHEPAPIRDPAPMGVRQDTPAEVAERARESHTAAGTAPRPATSGPVEAGLDAPGKEPEAAALAGVLPAPTPGLAPPGQGAQFTLTGDAQAAARGGLHGDMLLNVAARDAAILAGHVAPGATATAVAGAVQFATMDEIDEAEAEAIEKAHAAARDARIRRAAQKTAA